MYKRQILYKPEDGKIITDPEPHFDGKKLMFSSIGTSDRWHLFELDLTTGKAHQLTPDTYKAVSYTHLCCFLPLRWFFRPGPSM